jgi:hypothetical protein
MLQITIDLSDRTIELGKALVNALSGGKSATLTAFEPKTVIKKAPEPTEEAPKKIIKKATEPIEETPEESITEQLTIPAVSKQDVRALALKLSKAKKQDTLKEIFSKYGATKLSEIAEEDYASLLEDLQEASKDV